MKTGQKIITVIVSLLLFAACKDEYFPVIKELDQDILVVEGYIDGADETVFKLSRVTGVNTDGSGPKYIPDALVQIEDSKGNSFPLASYGNGDYRGRYSLNPSLQYRVKIKTSNQKEYASQFVQYKASPPIDQITYRMEADGARFLVSTHDNTARSRYYLWKYEETWQFKSYYLTEYQYNPVTSTVGELKDQIYTCWRSDYSREILLNSSENQTQDVMKDIPMLLIPNGSEKLSLKYSILIKQYVMDSLGYNYYRQLKKNTEETGGIFDPQPGNLKGNLMNLNDPLEVVVGYIGAGNSSERREFFQIPWHYREDCSTLIEVPNIPDSLAYYFLSGQYWPIHEDATSYVGAYGRCVDCRTRGTNIKPDFWP